VALEPVLDVPSSLAVPPENYPAAGTVQKCAVQEPAAALEPPASAGSGSSGQSFHNRSSA
jgi:hypothetical protein